MITYTYPIADNLPINTLVTRRLQTNDHIHTCTSQHMYMCTCTFNIEEETNCKQYDGPSEDLIDSLEQAVLPSTLIGEDYGDTHDPDEPGEHEVSHSETIPLAVIEEPVPTTTVVDKDHYHKREAVGVEGGEGGREEVHVVRV